VDLSGCHRGFAFGYLVASLLLQFQTLRSKTCPGSRFNIYWETELPTGHDWKSRCTLKALLACLHLHATFDSLIDKKKHATQYKKLQKHYCSTTTNNCNLLVTNHVLGICACLGMLPSWARGEIEISPSCHYMKWFLEKFNLPSSADTMEQITENLHHILSSCQQIPFSRQKLENIFCKV
jgi:hypothetical protein